MRARKLLRLAAPAILFAALATSAQAQTSRQDQDACTSLVPAAMGEGPLQATET
jgi:hypothetical protein